MDQCDYEVAGDVDACDDEHQCALGGAEYVTEAVDIVNLKVDSQNIVDDQPHQQEGVEREYVADIVCAFGPLGPKKTPSDAEDYHEDVDEREYLGCILDDVAGAGLDDCSVESKQVEGGDEVAVDEPQQS